MIFQGENVSIYTYYKKVYKKVGLIWALKIFHSKIKVWWWRTREDKNAWVWLLKRRVRRLIRKYLEVL